MANRKTKFLSLKWKALLFLSIVLIALNFTFYYVQYHSLHTNFDRYRSVVDARNHTAIQGLTEQTAFQLQQIGELIPYLYGMENKFVKPQAESITQAFVRHWPLLQVDLGVETIAFFNVQNELLSAWGDYPTAESISDPIQAATQQVILTERPKTILDCRRNCRHYALVPVLAEGRLSTIILLGTSLAELIVDFRRVAATDIGVIIHNQENMPNNLQGETRLLTPWDAQIVALSNAHRLEGILQSVSHSRSLEDVIQHGTVTHTNAGVYEIRLHSLNRLADQGAGYLVVISDISEQISLIRMAAKDTIFVGIIGFVLSELALLMVLWAPLSRLRQTAEILPLLGQHAYEAVRTTLAKIRKPELFADEISQLNDTTVQLSQQLQSLETKVEQRTGTLAKKMTELTQERDFIRGLLDTAQVIIVTQDQQGHILLVNKYGEALTGYSATSLLGKPFASLMQTSTLPANFDAKLSDIADGRIGNLQHESTLLGDRGSTRMITWLHSHLDSKDENGPNILSVGLDITDRKKAESHLAWLANHDHLTGLYNRRRFQEECKSIVSIAHRYNRHGALLFLDLDYFKYINDSSGHHVGDALIKAVANELLQMLRDTDVAARIGGDEFAIVMPEIDDTGACKVAQKINKKLENLFIPIIGKTYRVTTSIGIVLFPEHGTAVDELLSNADIAMYQAKDRGRGSWHLFSREEQARERIEEHVLWKQRIEHAFINNTFFLHYQPIMDLSNNRISHYEVLLRMKTPDGETVLPTEFIEIAEKTGQIHSIDHWVLAEAMQSLKLQLDQGNNVNFSINLSAHAFMDPELLNLLKGLLNETAIPADRLIFELTETAALADFTAACELMDTIRALGCQFALDDFGVGFSSFYYLKQLPVDYVKLDGSYIQTLSSNTSDQILVKAMSNIARGFGKKTIAEFVENEETLQLLRKYGVNYAQGYHIGEAASIIPPMPNQQSI